MTMGSHICLTPVTDSDGEHSKTQSCTPQHDLLNRRSSDVAARAALDQITHLCSMRLCSPARYPPWADSTIPSASTILNRTCWHEMAKMRHEIRRRFAAGVPGFSRMRLQFGRGFTGEISLSKAVITTVIAVKRLFTEDVLRALTRRSSRNSSMLPHRKPSSFSV